MPKWGSCRQTIKLFISQMSMKWVHALKTAIKKQLCYVISTNFVHIISSPIFSHDHRGWYSGNHKNWLKKCQRQCLIWSVQFVPESNDIIDYCVANSNGMRKCHRWTLALKWTSFICPFQWNLFHVSYWIINSYIYLCINLRLNFSTNQPKTLTHKET